MNPLLILILFVQCFGVFLTLCVYGAIMNQRRDEIFGKITYLALAELEPDADKRHALMNKIRKEDKMLRKFKEVTKS